ncbi:zinc-binding alcohol dehydrogenase [Chloroflexi bacterium TSY]|nr:zinc-binding alcohol dehydrogenase [Chloroflexi bacterium TSY]
MKALIIRNTSPQTREKVFVSDWPEPEAPTGNQVKIRTLYSGITNGTERNQLLRGNYAPPDERLPLASGYQTVGRIVETGSEVRTLHVGDLIFVGAHTGGHLEYVVLPEDDLLVKLPHTVEPQEAALFGMGSVALNTCRNAELTIGEKVLVVGGGCVGQITAQIAALLGAQVTLVDIDDHRLAVARQIGAVDAALNVAGEGWTESIADESFDAVVDLAGVPGMEDQLIRATRRKGRVLFIAGRDRVNYSFNLGQGRIITIKQNSHFDRDDLANFCRLVSRGSVQLKPLIQDVVPAEDAKRIYDILRDQPNALLGTVFSWKQKGE